MRQRYHYKKGIQMGVWNKSDNNTKTLEEIFIDLVGGTNL